MRPSLRIIESEHRSLSAVLGGLAHFASGGLEGKPVPEPRVFRAMLQYLDLFAERTHHPKEDQYLFARLRVRSPEAADILDRLQDDHVRGAGRLRALEQSFVRYEEGGGAFFKDFARCVSDYAAFYRQHMRTEEQVIFPLAERVLSDEDWGEIDRAFAAHHDPLEAVDGRDLQGLFTRIVTITPAPIGVGAPL